MSDQELARSLEELAAIQAAVEEIRRERKELESLEAALGLLRPGPAPLVVLVVIED